MDIFVDPSNSHIYLVQEYANHGHGMDYFKGGGLASEEQLVSWARSLYGALDHLGSLGIAHRSIHPKHILFMGDKTLNLTAKLSGFRDAIIYWDPVKGDIINQPCKSSMSFRQSFFHAPEIFGRDGDLFDPIPADIWSFGATLFYFVAHTYPFNPSDVPSQGLDAEIRNTVAACENITDAAKYWLYGLMRPNTKFRTDFDAIPDAWFKGQAE